MHHLIQQAVPDRTAQTSLDAWIRILGKITIAAGIIGPITVIPQIYEIYSQQNATGVSAFSWFAFSFLDIPFILYGCLRRDLPIVSTYTLWLLSNGAVAIGSVLYS